MDNRGYWKVILESLSERFIVRSGEMFVWGRERSAPQAFIAAELIPLTSLAAALRPLALDLT